MFATGGFWLPFLSELKHYRIIILTIDYYKLLNKSKEIIEKEINEIIIKTNVSEKSIWICHSLGCSFYEAFIKKWAYKNFQICPVYLGKRKEFDKFVNDISTLFCKPIKEIEEKAKITHSNMNNFLKKINNDLELIHTEVLVPTGDQYFLYPTKNLEFIPFKGDHYNITDAIRVIAKNL